MLKFVGRILRTIKKLSPAKTESGSKLTSDGQTPVTPCGEVIVTSHSSGLSLQLRQHVSDAACFLAKMMPLGFAKPLTMGGFSFHSGICQVERTCKREKRNACHMALAAHHVSTRQVIFPPSHTFFLRPCRSKHVSRVLVIFHRDKNLSLLGN